MDSDLIISILSGIAVVGGTGLVLWLLSSAESRTIEKKKEDAQFVREISSNLEKHHWRSLRLLDAISAGATIEYVDVAKNNVIIKTPDGLVEAKVNRINLPKLLLELKVSEKTPYRHTDIYLNMDMDNQTVIIDNFSYA